MTGVSTSRPHLLPITFLATIMTTVLFVIQTHTLAPEVTVQSIDSKDTLPCFSYWFFVFYYGRFGKTARHISLKSCTNMNFDGYLLKSMLIIFKHKVHHCVFNHVYQTCWQDTNLQVKSNLKAITNKMSKSSIQPTLCIPSQVPSHLGSPIATTVMVCLR